MALSKFDTKQPIVQPNGLPSKYLAEWLPSLWNSIGNVIVVAQNFNITDTQNGCMFVCLGTISLGLPSAVGRINTRFWFINKGTDIVTIAGTVNGQLTGYSLSNQYQGAFVFSDGTDWLAFGAN